MRKKVVLVVAVLCVTALIAWAQETPKGLVTTYESLADAILALKRTEAGVVRAILETHYRHAEACYKGGDFERAAAEMALFANEGDNAIGGIRKRLLEGGHHHNADGEAKGIYEPGYVLVTREFKAKALAACAALRQATTQEAREQAWKQFVAIAGQLT